jgi:hypothetical protein
VLLRAARSQVYACGMIVIAEVYVGFSVADGRPKVIAVEVRVATAFVVLAAMAITAPAWLVVAGLRTESRTSGSNEPASCKHTMVATVLRHRGLGRRCRARRRDNDRSRLQVI